MLAVVAGVVVKVAVVLVAEKVTFCPSHAVLFTRTQFKTPKGKIVYGGGGIIPDVFVAIDTNSYMCPPSLGLLTLNGLVAAREVLLPIQCEYYALEGLSQLLKTVDMIKEHLNPELYVTAIILTMYDGRTRLASQVADEVRNHFGARVLETIIPRNVRVSEAPSYGQTVLTYDPASSGAVSYREAAAQLDIIQQPS